MSELKPCPFCGEGAELINQITTDLTGALVDCYFVICTNKRCKNLKQYSLTSEEAIAAWNRRYPDGELERMKEINKALEKDNFNAEMNLVHLTEEIERLKSEVSKMNINDLIKQAHENAVEHGFWDEERSFAETIALVHSEISEALEEYRDGRGLDEVYYSCTVEGLGGQNCLYPEIPCPEECPNQKPEGIPIELADVIIRIFDTCGKYGINLEEAIKIKMAYNQTRPYKHGKKC